MEGDTHLVTLLLKRRGELGRQALLLKERVSVLKADVAAMDKAFRTSVVREGRADAGQATRAVRSGRRSAAGRTCSARSNRFTLSGLSQVHGRRNCEKDRTIMHVETTTRFPHLAADQPHRRVTIPRCAGQPAPIDRSAMPACTRVPV